MTPEPIFREGEQIRAGWANFYKDGFMGWCYSRPKGPGLGYGIAYRIRVIPKEPPDENR